VLQFDWTEQYGPDKNYPQPFVLTS